MEKNKSKNLLALLGGILLMSFPLKAQAQWPTFDVAAIKQAITSNIELVKQSKIVTDATSLAGKINSGIGDAKASMSKYAGDNLEKAKEKAEKVKKEKSRLDKMKEKYNKAKEYAEKKKQELEEAKAWAEEQKSKAMALKDEAMSYKDLATEGVGAVKDFAADVKSTASDATSMAGDLKSAAGAKLGAVKSQAGLDTADAVDNDIYDQLQITSDDKVYGDDDFGMANLDPELQGQINQQIAGKFMEDIRGAENERDAALARLEELRANGEDTSEAEQALAEAESRLRDMKQGYQQVLDDKGIELPNGERFFTKGGNAVNQNAYEEMARAAAANNGGVDMDAMMQDEYEKAARAAGSMGVSADFKVDKKAAVEAVGDVAPVKALSKADGISKAAVAEMPKKLDKAGVSLNKAEVAAPALSKASVAAPLAMEKKAAPSVNKNGQPKVSGRKAFQKRSDIGLESKNKFVSRSFSETVSFADVAVGMTDNTFDGEFVASESFFDYCGFNAKDANEENITDCIKKIIEAAESENQQDAATAQALLSDFGSETVIGMAAKGMKNRKDVAGNDEKQDKLNETAGSADNQRDDTAALVMNDKELQVLGDGLLGVYASKLILDSFSNLSFVKVTDTEEVMQDPEHDMVDATFDGKFAGAPAMYEICEFSAKDVSEDSAEVTECMEKIVQDKNDPDMKIAAEGLENYNKVRGGTSIGMVPVALDAIKEVAYNDAKVEKIEEEAGDAKNATADVGALTLSNKEILVKFNKVLDIFSAQLLLDSLSNVGGLNSQALPSAVGEQG
ncbi:MAG: hypothetical protein J6A33_04100 [Alphaproteobacteria bacterium]|nr:hypothetical protein [Alphaproteobacteria bacterium]